MMIFTFFVFEQFAKLFRQIRKNRQANRFSLAMYDLRASVNQFANCSACVIFAMRASVIG
jgi:hypothetical protein